MRPKTKVQEDLLKVRCFSIMNGFSLFLVVYLESFTVFPKWNRNSQNLANSGNLINH